MLDLVITNAMIVDHSGIYKADIGIRNGRITGIGKAGNPDVMDGVTQGMIIGAGTEVIAGEGKIVTAGGIDSHVHFICPQLIETALSGGTDDANRRRHGSCHRHRRHHVHSGRVEHPPHAGIRRRISDESGIFGQGQLFLRRAAARADRGGRHRPEAARRLGHDAGGHRLRALRCGRARRAGRHSHRHDQRSGLRAGFDSRVQGTHHSHVSHRRRRRRPRSGHHQRLRRTELPAFLDQSHDAVHRKYAQRASGHADGVPPSEPFDSRRRRVRRIAHPRRNDCRRRRSARSGRDQHDVVGFAGHGAHRRSHHAHLADRRQNEAPARRPARRKIRQRQLARETLRREVHDQSRHRARNRARSRIGGNGKTRGPRALEARVLRREAGNGREGRHDRVVRDGRRQRFDSHAAAGDLPAHVRQLRRRAAFHFADVFVEGRGELGIARHARTEKERRRGEPLPRAYQARHDPQRRAAENRRRSGHLRSARRRSAPDLRAGASFGHGAALFPVLLIAEHVGRRTHHRPLDFPCKPWTICRRRKKTNSFLPGNSADGRAGASRRRRGEKSASPFPRDRCSRPAPFSGLARTGI